MIDPELEDVLEDMAEKIGLIEEDIQGSEEELPCR